MSVAARALLEQDAAHVIVVEFPDATVDIDTQDDYQALILGQHNKVKTPS